MTNYIVIKLGGSIFEALHPSFYENIIHLQERTNWKPIIVHGGGPLITALLKKLGIKTHFVNGLRVTTNEVLDIVEMVLSGSVNKQIVCKILAEGGKAFGLSGIDGQLITATPVIGAEKLGYVGEIVSFKQEMIHELSKNYIPVISPLGIDASGQRYNINGDVAASAIAKSLGAKLCFVSDIPGIYVEANGQRQVLKTASKEEIEQLIEEGIISGGMVPKVKAALDGLMHHIPEVAIINGMEVNSLLDFCNGKAIGTKIVIGETNYV